MSLTPAQMARYRRQITLLGADAQEALLASHVAVIGAGGLGSPALLYLAGAGVGRITIVDDDIVDLSNLHRQVIHRDGGVDKPKAESARAAMLELNPTIQVDIVQQRLRWPESLDVLADADVVLDGTDNFDTRHVISSTCARRGIPHVWASILGFDAQLSVFHAGHGPVYEDVFPTPPPPGAVPSCSQAGVLGPVVGVVGSAMAVEALKLLTKVGKPLIGTLAYYSSLDGRWEDIPISSSPDALDRLLTSPPASQDRVIAPLTLSVPEVTTIPEDAVVIDVREPEEFAQFAIPGAVNIPHGLILDGDNPAELDTTRPVVIYCGSGIRSAKAVAALAARGITTPVSLRGGIDAWLDQQH